jgi:hypothetical protein
MLRHRPRRTLYSWLWQPATGWWLLALLYVVGAVLSVFLTVAMDAWEPLLLVVALICAAVGCVLAALDKRR